MNQGVCKLPKKPFNKKTYFQADTSNGPSSQFTKDAYQLVANINITLVHYLDDENMAVHIPHGNTKHNKDCGYVLTCPSALRKKEYD